MKDKCPHCGAKMKIYRHDLNRPSVKSIDKLAIIGGTASISHIGLSHSQICNFHKLKYWGLVESLGEGVWQLTRRGYGFIRDIEAVPKTVYTFHGEVKEYRGELVMARDYIESEYKHRKDYAIESTSASKDENGRLFA